MRIPRFRLTLRWMMLAVAIIGVAIRVFGPTIVARYQHAVLYARIHTHLQREMIKAAASYDAETLELKTMGLTRSTDSEMIANSAFARAVRLANYHAALKRKHMRSARYPWLSVEPDPPRPW